MTRVRAPGSSANLGPGFDVLGLAIARYVWAWDEADLTTSGRASAKDVTGSPTVEPCGPDHIARIAYEQAGGSAPLWFDYEVEPSRGLGFSAAARAAGAMLAMLQQGYGHDEAQHRAYQVVADIEGHGDNAAPSVFGGTYVIAGDVYHRLQAPFPGRLLFWVPDFQTSTDDSRACLPVLVERSDAIFNLGRVGLLIAAIYEGRLDLLSTATEDRLHQPLRLAGSDECAKAYRAALEAGAAAAWLSGSGPTIAVVVDDASADMVAAVLAGTGEVLPLEMDHIGAISDPLT